MTANDESRTAAQLRSDIDHGRTRDKVDATDLAAAPLGTDDEAAGTPPSPDELALAARNEPREDIPTDVNRSAPTARHYPLPPVVLAVLIGVGVLIAAAALAYYALE
jgi:hypothetical protein